MPKKFSVVQMREWLRQYEEGRPEATIAKEARCDIRTLKKGVEIARREREASAARTEILKESLRKHQHDLMNLIGSIHTAMVMPDTAVVTASQEREAPVRVSLSGASARRVLGDGVEVTLSAEGTALWDLLQEHLRGDTLWDYLNRWKKAMAAHLEAALALKQKTYNLVEKRTQYQVIEDRDAPPKKGSVYSAGAGFLYQVVLERALGKRDWGDVEQGIQVTTTGYVEHRQGSPVMAYAPGAETKCRERILRVLKEIGESPEVERARTTHKAIEEPAAKAKRSTEELTLLGLVPGQCRVCRRLGM